MKGVEILCLVALICGLLPSSLCDGGVRGGEKARRGPRKGGKGRHPEPGPMVRALQINYPLSIYTVESADVNWRDAAHYNKDLVTMSEDGKPYAEIARAQDQEDVWLYENWFYGMKDGVIMESGALNGLLFSTSYMFEKFANWTSIHVGKFLIPE